MSKMLSRSFLPQRCGVRLNKPLTVSIDERAGAGRLQEQGCTAQTFQAIPVAVGDK